MAQRKQKAVPELRFPGFLETWEERVLGDFMTFKNGVNADKSKYGRGEKFINVLDVISGKPIYYKSILGRVEVSDKEFEKNEVKYGDILFQRSSETREEVGQSNVYLDKHNPATFGGFVIRGSPTKKFDPVYFHYLLKTPAVRKEITSKSGGSTRYNVGQDTLSNVRIGVSEQEKEQQKIADFLTTVDNKLTALRRKRKLLQTYKRGMMQKLFSQALRFEADDGSEFPEWEEKRLGDLASLITKGTTPSSIGFSFVESGINFIKAENLLNGSVQAETTQKISPDCDIALERSRLKVGDLLFTIAGTLGRTAVVDHSSLPANTNQAVAIIRLKTLEKIRFIHFFLNSPAVKRYINYSVAVGAQPNLSLKQVREIGISIPPADELQKIANFLTALDTKIDAVGQQIESMQTFKKGLLQKLFV